MFGIKFRSWMESHIVRPRKKQRSKDGGKNGKNAPERSLVDSVGSSPTNTSVEKKEDVLQEAHCKSSVVASNVTTTITLSPPNHPGFHQPVGNNLSSPESAYSTGYSTDGTSPGAGPEYYINIRTGTHYFLPNAANPQLPSTTETRGAPTTPSNTHSVHLSTNTVTKTLLNGKARATPDANPSSGFYQKQQTTSEDNHRAIYKAPLKMAPAAAVVDAQPNGHRRTESCDESHRFLANPVASPTHSSAHLTSSPRQRTRIRTNPWLSSNTLSPVLSGLKARTSIIESTTSSSSGFKKGLTESSSSYGSSSGKLSSRGGDVDRDSICSLTSSCSDRSHASEGTDDDLTLNEMLGKFDESYVYEKETDILSDSDPTDCDETDMEAGQEGGDECDTQDEEELDFIDKDSPLDLPFDDDKGNKGHCTYHDFARKPRYRESVRRRSVGKNEEGSSSPRARQRSSQPSRRSSRDGSKQHGSKQEVNNPASSQSSSKCVGEKKRTRQSVHKSTRERNMQNRNRLQSSPIFKEKFFKNVDNNNGGKGLNFNRILMQKMLSRENGIGTRSAGNTPISSRKRVGADVIRSPKKTAQAFSNAHLDGNREKDFDAASLLHYNSQKRRSNSVSYVRSNSVSTQQDQLTAHASELALIEADKEADRKYKQLILEAEHILTSMKDQIPIPLPKHTIPKPNFLARKFDLDKCLASPKLDRKELPKKLPNMDYPPVVAKRNKCFSPLARRAHLDPNTELRRGRSRSGQDSKEEVDNSMESDSDGSLTPRQEDFDDPYRNSFKSFDWHQNSCRIIEGRQAKRSLKSSSEALWHQESDIQNGNVVTNTSRLHTAFVNQEREVKKLGHKHRSPLMTDRRSHKPKLTENNLNLTSNTSSVKGDVFLYPRDASKNSPELVKKIPSKMVNSPTLAGVSRPPLVAFRSVDLGSKLDDSNYCPQSEPVKRKVYTCSATFGRLRKSIGGNGQLGTPEQKPECVEDDSRNSLREKLERLRRERDDKEQNQIADANLTDKMEQNQRQLSLIRRQMLVNTIEGLKRSLEDQSAKLKAAYCVNEANPLPPKRS